MFCSGCGCLCFGGRHGVLPRPRAVAAVSWDSLDAGGSPPRLSIVLQSSLSVLYYASTLVCCRSIGPDCTSSRPGRTCFVFADAAAAWTRHPNAISIRASASRAEPAFLGSASGAGKPRSSSRRRALEWSRCWGSSPTWRYWRCRARPGQRALASETCSTCWPEFHRELLS